MTEKNGGILPISRKMSCLKKNSGFTSQGRREVEVGTLSLGNDNIMLLPIMY